MYVLQVTSVSSFKSERSSYVPASLSELIKIMFHTYIIRVCTS